MLNQHSLYKYFSKTNLEDLRMATVKEQLSITGKY